MAIDREAILDTIIGGYGRLAILRGWSYNEQQLGNRRWEYNPDRARELLAEAGYSEGFSITLTPAIRNAPSEVELCEAIASIWNDIGIDVKFQRIPYGTFRPQAGARTYVGSTCHAHTRLHVPGSALLVYTTAGSFSLGAAHPFIEEKFEQIVTTVDDVERERLEMEVGAFRFDNALTGIGLITGNAVWPVGPGIEEWTQDVGIKELRNINCYEFIRHRQQ